MYAFLKHVIVVILTAEARFLLARKRPTVIAITGSVGKTSMKDAIYAIVKERVHARKSEKSFNSELGIPLTVLGLPNAWNSPVGWLRNIVDGAFIAIFARSYPELLVIEAGVDRPGDMRRLTAWLRPKVVVLTRLPDVPVHVEYFSSPEAVAEEKLLLPAALSRDGIIVYNHDDLKLSEYAKDVQQKAIGYGRDLPTDVTARADATYYEHGVPAGFKVTVEHGGEAVEVKVPGVCGWQLSYTVAGALATAVATGLPLIEAARALSQSVPPPGRMRILAGIKSTAIIDDSYNSSPVAVAAALETLNELKVTGRKIAVLGDMLELGRFSLREHERAGELAAKAVDVLVTVGIRSQKTAEAALGSGLSEEQILQYEEVEKAGRELQNFIKPGDVLLIKGSQGMRMERIVLELMAEPDRASELLPRQDDAWQER